MLPARVQFFSASGPAPVTIIAPPNVCTAPPGYLWPCFREGAIDQAGGTGACVASQHPWGAELPKPCIDSMTGCPRRRCGIPPPLLVATLPEMLLWFRTNAPALLMPPPLFPRAEFLSNRALVDGQRAFVAEAAAEQGLVSHHAAFGSSSTCRHSVSRPATAARRLAGQGGGVQSNPFVSVNAFKLMIAFVLTSKIREMALPLSARCRW